MLQAGGLGLIKVGMPLEDAVGIAHVKVTTGIGACDVGTDPLTAATVVGKDGAVLIVTVQDPGVRTNQGIQVGSTAEEVGAAYGAVQQPVVVPDGDNELVIGLEDGVVSYMVARRTGISVGC